MSRTSPIPSPRDPRLETWRTFLVAHAQVRRQLERELQAEQSLGLGGGSAGLGLAIVRHIAEAHRGSAGVRSIEGVGSTFWVELPRAT